MGSDPIPYYGTDFAFGKGACIYSILNFRTSNKRCMFCASYGQLVGASMIRKIITYRALYLAGIYKRLSE